MSLLIFVLFMGVVSASDDDSIALGVDDAGLDEEVIGVNSSDMLSVSSGRELSQSNIVDASCFSELQSVIDDSTSGDVIILGGDIIQDGNNPISISIGGLTIDGDGHTIDANGSSQIFNISANSITLRNIVFKNGYAINGGALYFASVGSGVNITGCSFISNRASSGGGAIYFGDNVNTVYISDCVFTSNNVYNTDKGVVNGGAIYFNGSVVNLNINCNFDSNYVISGGARRGGALYFASTMTTSSIRGNFSRNYVKANAISERYTFQGGAIYWLGDVTNSIIDGNFTGNYAENSNYKTYWHDTHGGALYFASNVEGVRIAGLYAGNYIKNSQTAQNRNNYGGAIFITSLLNSNITGVFDSNHIIVSRINAYGGAVYIKSASGSNYITGNFTNNYIKRQYDSYSTDNLSAYGAGIYVNSGSVIVNSSNFTGNYFITSNNNYPIIGYGAGIANKGTLIINGGEFSNNSGMNGGVIYNTGTLIIDNNANFSHNTATNGGVIYNTGTVNGGLFENNSAVNGGVIYGSGSVNGGVFIDNSAVNGGVIYFTKSSTVSGGNYTRNSANNGGAIYVNDGTLCIMGDISFSANMADDGEIFGNYTNNTGKGSFKELYLYIKENAFPGNVIKLDKDYFYNPNTDASYSRINIDGFMTVDGQGHTIEGNNYDCGIWVGGTNVVLKNFILQNTYCSYTSVFIVGENCTAVNLTLINLTSHHHVGGAIAFAGQTDIGCALINSTLINNTSPLGGGAVLAYVGNVKLINSTFINNTGSEGGAVWFSASGNHLTYNCTFINNHATKRCGALYLNTNNCTVINSRFINNIANNTGAAAYATGYNNATFENCYFSNNLGDIILNCYLGNITVKNSTFEENYYHTSLLGSRVYTDNCTIKDNDFDEWTKLFKNLNDGSIIELNKDYTVTGSVTISANNVVVDGKGHIINGNGKQAIIVKGNNVTIKNVIMKNGYSSSNGGAIYFNYATAGKGNGTVINSTFINNNVNGNGGAIAFVNTKEGIIINSTFIDNTAVGSGGAVYINRGGYITDSEFYNNQASNGGAVRLNSVGNTLPTINNSIFINNTATNEGGAIYSYRTANITDSTFTSNNASSQGGAITCSIETSSNPTHINNSTFNGNTASAYPAISGRYTNNTYLDLSNNTANELYEKFSNLIDGSLIELNTDHILYNTITVNANDLIIDGKGHTIDANGKNAFIFTGNNITVKNLIIKNAYVSGNGAAIYFTQSATIQNSTFINNTATASGGAIYFAKEGKVINSTFTKNDATNGAGIYFNNKADINNTIFTSNTATRDHAFYTLGEINITTTTIDGKKFNDNNFTSLFSNIKNNDYINIDKDYTIYCGVTITADNIVIDGNGFTIDGNKNQVFYISGNNVTIKNLIIKNAKVYGYGTSYAEGKNVYGGAIYFVNYATVINSTFKDNSALAQGSGGALFFKGDGLVINSTFINNNAQQYNGGGIYFTGKGTVINSTFTNNKAKYGGAAEFVGDGIVINSTFTGNSGGSPGGALYFHNNCDVLNSTFIKNRGGRKGGAIVSTTGTIKDSIFINNSGNEAGAIYFNSKATLINITCINTTSDNIGGALILKGESEVINSTFISNTAIFGAGIYSTAIISVINTTFENNNATTGGAIYMEGGNCFINASIFKGNVAESYRNIYNHDGEINIINTTLETSLTINQINNCLFNSSIIINGTFDDGTNVGNITIKLLNNNKYVDTLIINKNNTFTYTWNNLQAGNYTISIDTSNYNQNIYSTNYSPIKFEVYKANSKIIINTPITTARYNEIVNISFTVENKTTITYIIKTKQGNIIVENTTTNNTIQISNLNPGEYIITIANAENNNFNSDVKYAEFKVNNATINSLNINVNNVYYPNKAYATITASVDGEYIIIINNKTYSIIVNGGLGIFEDFDVLNTGNYTIQAISNISNYYTKIEKTTFNVLNGTITTLNINVENINYPDRAYAIVSASVDGEYVVIVNNKSYVVNVSGGVGVSESFEILNVGAYNVTVFSNIENYNVKSVNGSFSVNAGSINMTFVVGDVDYPDVVNVIVNTSVAGNYTISVLGTNVTFDVGVGVDEVNKDKVISLDCVLPVGSYVISLTSNVENYGDQSVVKNFNIHNGTITTLNVEISDVCYPDRAYAIVSASVDGEYIVSFNNKNYTVIVSRGIGISDDFELIGVGVYNVSVTSNIDNYDMVSCYSVFNVFNGTIESLVVSVANVSYGDIPVVFVNASVGGKYRVVVEGTDVNKVVLINSSFSLGFVELPILGVKSHYNVSVVSCVDNYNIKIINVLFSVNPIPSSLNISGCEFVFGGVGNINFTYYGALNITAFIVDSDANIFIDDNHIILSNLDAGNYLLVVSTIPDSNHTSISKTVSVKVDKADPHLSLNVINVTYPNNVSIILKSEVDGVYSVDINGSAVIVVVENGIGFLSIKKSVNVYNASVSLIDNVNYIDSWDYCIFSVYMNMTYEFIVEPKVASINYGESISFYAGINDDNATGNVIFFDLTNNKLLGIKSINEILTLDMLPAGDYNISVSFTGDYNYESKYFLIYLEVNKVIDDGMDIIVSPSNYIYGGNTIVWTYVNTTKYPNVDGYVEYYINGTKIGESNINGEGFVLSNLASDNYVICGVFVSNDGNYEFNSKFYEICVLPANSTINSNDLTVSYDANPININYVCENATGIMYHVYDMDKNLVEYSTVGLSEKITLYNLVVGKYSIILTTITDKNHTAFSKQYMINIELGEIKLNTTIKSAKYPNDVIVTITTNISGKYQVFINNSYLKEINLVKNNPYNLIINKLDVGEYIIKIKSNIINYNTKEDIKIFKVYNGTINLNLDVSDISYPENLTINLKTNVSGKYRIQILERNFIKEINLISGIVESINLGILPPNSYTINISSLIKNYEAKSIQKIVKINESIDYHSTVIISKNTSLYYHNGTKLEAKLVDANGNAIINENIEFEINGKNYTRITDSNGIARIAINLDVGEYTVNIYYAGNKNQKSAKNTVIVSVLSTINGTNIVKIFHNDTQYYATFKDSKGNYLANGMEVTFNINGVMYHRKINGNMGLVRLNINLDPGEYILTAINPVNNEMISNIIKVIPRIIENNDLVKYFKNNSQYRIKVLDDKGNAVGANEKVIFNINGVMYERFTDDDGYVQLRINLNPGDYVITAQYKGSMVSNKIKVLPIITAGDLIKKQGTPDAFKAKIVDGKGKPIAAQYVTFNINGVMYQRLTDNNGIAKLNINLGIGKFIITSMYNGAATSNYVTVTN